MKHYDVVIIGAGTAGLTARREVAKKTDNYVVVDDGPMGTTCARVGCMPSKVLIQAANDFDHRKKFLQMGIEGGESLKINPVATMKHVRALRDRFTSGVEKGMVAWQDKLVRKRAQFIDAHTLDIAGESVKADKIIIATGSRPIIPGPWMEFKEYLISTDQFFEMETLPEKVAVIGLGVIGIELGQALHRLGVDVIAITRNKAIGGLTDPELQDYVSQKFSEEMNLRFNGANLTGVTQSGRLKVEADGEVHEVDKVLVSVGRRANIDNIGLENLKISVNSEGIPEINRNTLKLKELPHIFLPGDVNADRSILHEAADEGLIAGHNAVNEEQCFKRRVSLGVTFSDPNIASIGQSFQKLTDEKINFITGKVSFEGQGRSIVKLKEQGLLHVYVQSETGLILGAELQAPDGEHLAHLLAWAISLDLNVFDALRMPFYHPVIEEGLRTALRNAARQISGEHSSELLRCSDAPIR